MAGVHAVVVVVEQRGGREGGVVDSGGGGGGSGELAYLVTRLCALSYTAAPMVHRVLCTMILSDYLVQWLYCCFGRISQQSEEAEFKPCLIIYFINSNTVIVLQLGQSEQLFRRKP